MLHMIQTVTYDDNIPPPWLLYASKDDNFLLLDDAVYAAQVTHSLHRWLQQAQTAGQMIYVLLLDIQARGLDQAKLLENIVVITDKEWIDLVAKNTCVQTW